MLVALGLAGLAYRWTMHPLNSIAAAKPKPRMRFSIADFLCLFVQVQIMLPLILLVARDRFQVEHRFHESHVASYFILTLLILVIAYATWWDPVRTLNRAEVFSTWRRAITLVVAAPVCLAGSIAFAVLSIVSVVGLFAFLIDRRGPDSSFQSFLVSGLSAALIWSVLLGLRALIRRVIARRPPGESH
jgi:hypothetical protein